MKINLSISPCPNDTFMFDALINGRIDTGGLEFNVRFADIEELNSALIAGKDEIHVSKSSYAIVPLIKDRYAVLRSGSALGRGNGPLLVAADEEASTEEYAMRIAIPGVNTTANLLMERLFPKLHDKRSYLFSDILRVVERGECDCGVLIHEGRFVYRDHGLHLLADLGERWENKTKLPLPLGSIMISRSLPVEIQNKIDDVLRRSIEYAFVHPQASREFVKQHAQEMDDTVIDSHIKLFVNEHSIDIGPEGEDAVHMLLDIDPAAIFIVNK